MGFLDDARRVKELRQADPSLSNSDAVQLVEEEKRRANVGAFSQHFAPGAVEPYIEEVPHKLWKKDREAFLKTYIGIVGLQPEDTFGIYVTDEDSSYAARLRIVYRDRPEYATGRRRYHQVIVGE